MKRRGKEEVVIGTSLDEPHIGMQHILVVRKSLVL